MGRFLGAGGHLSLRCPCASVDCLSVCSLRSRGGALSVRVLCALRGLVVRRGSRQRRNGVLTQRAAAARPIGSLSASASLTAW